MKIVESSTAGSRQDDERTAIAQTVWVEGSHQIQPHRHERAQLIHSLQGYLVVEAGQQAYLLTSDTALWIPARLDHAVFAHDSVHYCSVFIESHFAQQLSTQVQRIYMHPLLQQLAIAAAEFDCPGEINAQQSRLLAVLIDQLCIAQPSEYVLALPRDRRLAKVMTTLVRAPSLYDDAESVAQRANVSKRTLERIYKKETGYSYLQWQQRLIVLHAIELLKNGSTIDYVAAQFGYQTASAFSAMFKRIMRQPPVQYIKTRQS